jgi:hypothetical protein
VEFKSFGTFIACQTSSKCKETKDPKINPGNAKFSSPRRYGEIASDGDG